jgi:hypothetical protein
VAYRYRYGLCVQGGIFCWQDAVVLSDLARAFPCHSITTGLGIDGVVCLNWPNVLAYNWRPLDLAFPINKTVLFAFLHQGINSLMSATCIPWKGIRVPYRNQIVLVFDICIKALVLGDNTQKLKCLHNRLVKRPHFLQRYTRQHMIYSFLPSHHGISSFKLCLSAGSRKNQAP